jgi:D-glycero-D-manno-heptose 1,7-bisphosphate phosphatase
LSSANLTAKPSHLQPAIFFDRDGIINERIVGGYIRNWDEFVLLPLIGKVLQEVKQRGYLAIIVTNQRGVGKGLMSEGDLAEIHRRLQSHMVVKFGVQFDDIVSCTDASDDSARRKPSPAMLLEAAANWNIDLNNSWMVGDSKSDIQAGASAGTKTAFVITPHTSSIPSADAVLHNLDELLSLI